ncbi:peptidoglycan editing factor PgeF [Gilvimarinus agarilyticus]|uniref:peptidoglycan editing factor PgeF n=1 Tax=Gilvimarinus sp. 2_MG-2023 TaxID=3062666 RepID=UPI001C09B2A3|nr:peptidoglycan editing factor PgeF [Gilvimarinus sp. 2_MG-2023]MBU2885200.1 peptidoglycan editing factor PgeF [Gilvimarinus agarilyticus]MDO6570097.1 peptidoglycan editing factor PgeF [Gilvimarinus sp. 2_MG-2023]
MSRETDFIIPEWPAPTTVRALTSTRLGGASRGGYASNNLALHVGDDESLVRENRQRLVEDKLIPRAPQWLEQVHGDKVVEASADGWVQTADACFTRQRELPCAVLTADCLPILLCNTAGTQVAAVHAGWRSLAAGIVRKTLATFSDDTPELMAWLGPAIGPAQFEVGVDVLEAFFASAIDDQHADMIAGAFTAGQKPMRFMADLYALARAELNGAGVDRIFGGDFCTYEQGDRFYSFRRDGKGSGRMASIIWLAV